MNDKVRPAAGQCRVNVSKPNGRGTSVPVNRRAKRSKIAATIGFIALAAACYAAALTPPTAAESGLAAYEGSSGAELFEANCARCHGPDGKGGKGPNLASEKRQAKWRDSDEKLIKKITHGGMFMPSFGKKLNPEEVRAIAGYVRTLKE